MRCDQCKAEMIKVGREIKPGDPSVWIDGWVCPTKRCPGYCTSDFAAGVSRWPALTLMDASVYSNIRGALAFKEGLLK